MRSLVLVGLVAACGGPQIPTHNGYKADKAKPWKKSKPLKLGDKGEAKADGELSYPDMRRAAWFSVDLPSNGELDLRLEITPPGEATNDEFDLAMEILDPAFRVISKSDLEEEDAHEVNKVRQLLDLPPGHYLIHLYLQGRMDTADYILHASFKATKAAEAKSDFPTQVAFLPPLPLVPITDDTPKNYKPPTTPVVIHSRTRTKQPKVDAPTPPPTSTITARVLGMQVVGNGTKVTVGRGTSSGASAGMKAKVNGVPAPAFTLDACSERTCTGVVAATPDQISKGGNVVLSP